MSWLHALILGLVQGLTEFFPVSSSAHLKIFKTFFNLNSSEETVLFDLFCHLGTFLALVYYFRKDIYNLLTHQRRRLIPLAAALLPLVPFYVLLKPVREALSNPHCLGYCMIGTVGLLYLAGRRKPQQKTAWTVKDSLWIGTLQAVALIPGVSRSAATITGGLWRGLSMHEAVRFSFLLSLPAVAGGTFLELFKARSHLFSEITQLPHCIIGFAAAAASGTVVIRHAIPFLQKGRLKPFTWYCLIVGILLIVYL